MNSHQGAQEADREREAVNIWKTLSQKQRNGTTLMAKHSKNW